MQADRYAVGLPSGLGIGSRRPRRYEATNAEITPAKTPTAMDHAHPRFRVNRKATPTTTMQNTP